LAASEQLLRSSSFCMDANTIAALVDVTQHRFDLSSDRDGR
jgi:hypothetical protein